MRKYDEYIDNVMTLVEDKTKEIANILNNESSFHYEEMEALISLYEERKEFLNELQLWYNSEESKDYLKENNNYWNSKINLLIKTDKLLLEKIDEILKDISLKLRNLVKNKSLLVYTK